MQSLILDVLYKTLQEALPQYTVEWSDTFRGRMIYVRLGDEYVGDLEMEDGELVWWGDIAGLADDLFTCFSPSDPDLIAKVVEVVKASRPMDLVGKVCSTR